MAGRKGLMVTTKLAAPVQAIADLLIAACRLSDDAEN